MARQMTRGSKNRLALDLLCWSVRRVRARREGPGQICQDLRTNDLKISFVMSLVNFSNVNGWVMFHSTQSIVPKLDFLIPKDGANPFVMQPQALFLCSPCELCCRIKGAADVGARLLLVSSSFGAGERWEMQLGGSCSTSVCHGDLRAVGCSWPGNSGRSALRVMS